jgi:hypothetical protein
MSFCHDKVMRKRTDYFQFERPVDAAIVVGYDASIVSCVLLIHVHHPQRVSVVDQLELYTAQNTHTEMNP